MASEFNLERLVELREKLASRIEELEKEIEDLRNMIRVLDRLIEGESFKPAIDVMEEVEKLEERPVRRERFFVWNGKEYAWINIYEHKVVIDISPELKLPIEHKLVNYLKRELDKYFEEDLRLEQEGKIDPKKRFIYTIDEEGGFLTQVEFLDYGDEQRRRDLLGKIRWVLRTFAKENL